MKAVLLLSALTIAFYWKLTLTRQFSYFNAPDLAYQVLPWYQFQAQAWNSGAFPLWDPHQWCGQPLLGQLQPGATFPLNWPLFAAPLREGRINLDFVHWHFVAMHLLAALFMYWYCRALERSRLASILAGAAFSFGGYIGTTTWPQMMNGALWLPLVFLFYHRAARGSATANAAACGASIGMSILAGHHQAPLLIALALTAVCLWQRRIRTLMIAGLFAALVGAFALAPAWEYGSRAYRWLNLPSPLRMDQTVPYTAHQGLGVIPLSLLGTLMPVDDVTANPFIGVVAVSLAVLGLAASWRIPSAKLHAIIALAGLAYALGSYSIFQGVLYAVVPFLEKARSPGHAILLFHFGLLVLAAHGVDAASPVWSRRLTRGLMIAGALGWIAVLTLIAGRGAFSGRAHSLMLAATVALLLAAMLHARLRAGPLVLMLVELSAGTAYLIGPRTDVGNPTYLDRLAQHRGVAEFLRSQPGPFRFHADEQEIPYNLGDWAGLDAATGYLASVSAGLYDFISLDWNRSSLYLNQIFLIGREKTRPEQVEVFSDPDGLKVFRNPDAFPRAWLVAGVRSVTDRGAASALMQSPGFDLRREAFVYGPAPALESCEGEGSTQVTDHWIHRVSVRVQSPCRRMLVVSDTWFPGWKAYIDGAAAPLYSPYGALRGTVVPPGEHQVDIVYRPASAYLGAALSLTGLAGCLALAAAARRKSRKQAVPVNP